MRKELLTLYSRIVAKQGDGKNAPSARRVTALNAEIAMHGYTFDARALTALRAMAPADFDALRTELHELLGEVSGRFANHQTLFRKFPYDTPDQDEYLTRRLIGFLQNELRFNIEHGRLLSCGHIVDTELFNLEDFGACPICQFQVDELDMKPIATAEFKALTPLKPISVATDRFLKATADALIARPSSLSLPERKLLLALRGEVRPAIPETVTRENIPLLFAFYGSHAVEKKLAGATDILRIATLMSDEDADLSLAKPVKFKLSTAEKRGVMRLLESLENPLEDLMRHREKWLRLAERLNPGSRDNRRRFPKTAAAFDVLRNDPGSIGTFNRSLEAAMRSRKVDDTLIGLLSKRPGEFLRKLDFMLRNDGGKDVLKATRAVAPRATTNLLFELRKYLQNRLRIQRTTTADLRGYRAFTPKGMVNRLYVAKDVRAEIDEQLLEDAIDIIRDVLDDRLKTLPRLGKTYVDPALKNIVVPYNRRGDSATNSKVFKGSRYPMGAGEVVRLFVHWTGMIDVDLSAILFDHNFRYVDHLSWTNLSAYGAVHSGDIQNAPEGASEFIDFDIDTLRQRNVRYVVASVISWRGDHFSSFPCFAGYMMRDAQASGEVYEPQSVALKFDIVSDYSSHMPLIFDLSAHHVVFADVSAGKNRHARVERDEDKHVALLRGALEMVNAKPTVYDVLQAHARARGIQVDRPAGADTRFRLKSLDMEEVMAMMSAPRPDVEADAKPEKPARASTSVAKTRKKG